MQMSKIKILETISETPYSRVSYCYLNDVKAVLKTKKEAIITNSIATELEIHQFLKKYDLCPEILDYDLLNNRIVYEFIGYPVQDSEYNQVFLKLFGETLSKLHCVSVLVRSRLNIQPCEDLLPLTFEQNDSPRVTCRSKGSLRDI